MKRLIILLLLVAQQASQAQSVDALVSGLTGDKKKADTLFFFARRCFMTAKFDSALALLDKGLPFAERTNDPELIAKYYMEVASANSFKGNRRHALDIIKKAAPWLTRTTSYDLHHKYLLMTGIFYKALPKNDSALYFYQQCEKMNNRENPYRNWLVYVEMALVFQYSEAFEESEKYYRQAYALTKSKGEPKDHGVVLNHFADMYYSWGKPAEFARVMNEFHDLAKDIKKDYSKDPVHSMLFIDWSTAPLDQKVQFMTRVRDDLQKNGFLMNAALANNYIAGFYEQKQQYEEALKYIVANRELIILETDINNLYINTKIHYRLLKKAGRHAEAVTVADRMFALKDSIIKIQQRSLSMEMDAKYQTEKKEKEIALLNSQNELNKLQLLREIEKGEGLQRENNLKEEKLYKELQLRLALERENILVDSSLAQQERLVLAAEREKELKSSELEKEKQLSGLLAIENELKQKLLNDDKKQARMQWAGIGLLVLTGSIILWQYRRQLKKNSIIEKQREDLKVLNREIHHRVKNNLQVISSLLDLQSQTMEDSKTAEKFQEGSQRVQSMAFIHQNLYQGENIDSIDIQEYVRMLTDNLMQSYNADTNRIHLSTHVEPIKLHSDSVIPIGMIINELVVNSLKYAFPGMASGEIQVVLKKAGEKILLQVKDNGVGMPPDIDIAAVHSFGYKIIKAFTQKLKANLTINNHHGTDVQLLISKYRTA